MFVEVCTKQKNVPYICTTKFADQDIAVALQYFIITLFCHTLYLYQKDAAFCNLDIALCHIANSIIFQLIPINAHNDLNLLGCIIIFTNRIPFEFEQIP